MAVTLPQPGEEYAPEVRHAHTRELELEVPFPPACPAPSACGAWPGHLPSMVLSFPICTLKGGDSGSGVDLPLPVVLQCRRQRRRTLNAFVVPPRVGDFWGMSAAANIRTRFQVWGLRPHTVPFPGQLLVQ